MLKHEDKVNLIPHWGRNFFTAFAVTLLLSWLTGNPAHAAGHVKVCNKGSVDVNVAEIDWADFLDSNPRLVGWLPLNVGDCYTKDGLAVEVSLAFIPMNKGLRNYYYFDKPELVNRDPFDDNPNHSVITVNTTTRQACVTKDRFDQKISKSELENCPSGWEKV